MSNLARNRSIGLEGRRSLRASFNDGLIAFSHDPPKTEFQRGYLAGLVNAWCIGGWEETEVLRACRLMLNAKQPS